MKKIIQNLIIIITLFSFCYFTYQLYNYNKEENEQKELKDALIENVIVNNSEDNSIEEGNPEKKLPIDVNFTKLKEQNKDIVAWLYCEDTPINYPIVQARDNNYYLRRLLDGTYNQAGTIFIDYKNNSTFEDYNTIIYGHNMKNDTMFGTLTNYQKQEYFDKHKEMYLFTENKNFKIQLFAGFTTSSESDIYKFPKTSTTNDKLIKKAISRSTFKCDLEVSNEDRIVTLSTCSYDFENARYVVFGVLRKIE